MATHRAGRLARTLKFAGAPLFGLYSEPLGGYYDTDIHSVAINRGKSGRGGGVHPSTMEVRLKGLHSAAVTGNNVRFFLRDAPAAAIAARAGVTADAIKSRFTGRMAQSEVDDDGKRFTSTYRAASWINRLYRSPKHATPVAGRGINSFLQDLMGMANPLAGIVLSFHGDFDQIPVTGPPVLFKDAIDKYTKDIGILVRETRDGRSQVMTLPYRITHTAFRLANGVPLTRSQAVTPARWQQRNDWPAQTVQYKLTNPNGNIVTRSVSIATEETPLVSDYDWSHIKAVTDQLYYNAYGMVYETNTRQFSLPSVTVDLLRLLGSDNPYHRMQAGRLLEMEAGDAVFLSGDWPAPVRGVHFAEGIRENITSDAWTLELELVPYAQAMGSAPSPVVPARAWESAAGPWSAETRAWNQA